jgi:hypothetical protein
MSGCNILGLYGSRTSCSIFIKKRFCDLNYATWRKYCVVHSLKENPKEKLKVNEKRKFSRLIEVEKDIKFPIKIIGTTVSNRSYFCSSNSFVALLLDRQNPYLYLTFQDQNGKIIGPVRYNSKLTGWGVTLGVGLRFQYGLIRGEYSRIFFNEIPRRFDVEGSSIGVTLSFFTGLVSTQLKVKDLPQLKMRYTGSTIGCM